jgi:hypothetical protein
VELAFGETFELQDGDADVLLQLRGQDIMWQKERLLNLAVAALPPSCRKVTWLDCDLIFAAPDWAERTSRLLDRFPLVQPFSRAYRTPRGWHPETDGDRGADILHATAHVIESGVPADACLRGWGEDMRFATGMAWAAARPVLDAHGLYDASIIGGGDSALLRAAYGYFDATAERLRLDARRERHYRAWAEPFFDAIDGEVGFVPGDVCHLWHGTVENRRYMTRFDDFAAFQFDPDEDIALDESRIWRWNSDKKDMHAYLRAYFDSRKEDD